MPRKTDAIAEALGLSGAHYMSIVAVRAACAEQFRRFDAARFNAVLNKARLRVGLGEIRL